MGFVQDSFDAGSVVAASLSRAALARLEPELRLLMVGRQLFTKQINGEYRPQGSQLGLAHYFTFTDLDAPALRGAAT